MSALCTLLSLKAVAFHNFNGPKTFDDAAGSTKARCQLPACFSYSLPFIRAIHVHRSLSEISQRATRIHLSLTTTKSRL